MRTLGKLFLIVSFLVLSAGLAAAGDFSPLQKNQPQKAPGIAVARGMLDCSGAIEIGLGDTYDGTTVGAPNNVGVYGCNTWDESGGEVVFHMFLAEPMMFEGTLTPADGCDLDLAVLDQCDEDLGCLIVVDTGVVTNSPVHGDFYFVVDGYAGAACDFSLALVEVVPPPPANACDVATILLCQDTALSGDTCDGRNDISSEDCSAYTEAGLEDWYEVTLNPDGEFDRDGHQHRRRRAVGRGLLRRALRLPGLCRRHAERPDRNDRLHEHDRRHPDRVSGRRQLGHRFLWNLHRDIRLYGRLRSRRADELRSRQGAISLNSKVLPASCRGPRRAGALEAEK